MIHAGEFMVPLPPESRHLCDFRMQCDILGPGNPHDISAANRNQAAGERLSTFLNPQL